jgi:hypothetical protein
VGTLLFDYIVGDANCHRIIAIDWGGWLGMAHFFQGETKNSLQLRNKAPSLAVEATTKRKIAQSVKKVPFNLIGFVGSGF